MCAYASEHCLTLQLVVDVHKVNNKRFAIGNWQNRAHNNNNVFLILNFEKIDGDNKPKMYISVLTLIDHYIVKFGRVKKKAPVKLMLFRGRSS